MPRKKKRCHRKAPRKVHRKKQPKLKMGVAYKQHTKPFGGDEHTRSRIRELYSLGYTKPHLAEIFLCKPNTIKHIVKGTYKGKGRRADSPESRAELKQKYGI